MNWAAADRRRIAAVTTAAARNASLPLYESPTPFSNRRPLPNFDAQRPFSLRAVPLFSRGGS
jgi:hypothetical protein